MTPAATINIKPVIYEKNTDGKYEKDTSGKKIILKLGNQVNSTENYEYLITITEYI